MFEITFLGTGGSCPYNNGRRTKFGTNSICIAVNAGGETLIFDAGTGICGFNSPTEYTNLFFTHYHTDHFGGILFYSDFFNPAKKFIVHGANDVKATMEEFLSPPIHPVGIDVFSAQLNFISVKPGIEIPVSDKVFVKTHNLSHPGGATAYRVEYDGKSFCYCADIELKNHKDDKSLLDFTHGADLLVMDSFFDDGKAIAGWGHSSWKECAEWAKQAEAKKLALFHHDYKLTDSDIEEIEEKAKKVFAGSFASADFMKIKL